MGAPCGLISHDRYAAKHDPFVFFNDINGWDGTQFQRSQRCIDHVVDYSQLDKDIAANALPKYAFITPNLDNDMHDGTIEEGDAWLAHEVPKIMATDAYKNGGVIFLLWDEGGGSPAADDPPFITLSPNAHAGMQSTTRLRHELVLEDGRDDHGRRRAAVRCRRSVGRRDGRAVHDADDAAVVC